MKTKNALLVLFSLVLIMTLSCEEEKDRIEKSTDYHKSAKIKRIWLYASVDAEEPINIVAEYEYDNCIFL